VKGTWFAYGTCSTPLCIRAHPRGSGCRAHKMIHAVGGRHADVERVNSGLLRHATTANERGRSRVSCRRLIDNELRNEQLERIPRAPPVSRDLVVRREHQISARKGRQIADDGRLNVRLRPHRCHSSVPGGALQVSTIRCRLNDRRSAASRAGARLRFGLLSSAARRLQRLVRQFVA